MIEGLDEILNRTLDDHCLSRGEKRVLGQMLREAELNAQKALWLQAQAFDVARQRLCVEDRAVADWLEGVVKAVWAALPAPAAGPMLQARFAPEHDCAATIVGLFQAAHRTVDVCVFSITHDVIATAILEAHRRGVAVRIITDDQKAQARGSDIDRFIRAGIPVRTDSAEYHMHHKFAVFDAGKVLTGSYNWTRRAAEYNQENILLCEDANLAGAFTASFEALWAQFLPLHAENA